MLPRVATLAAVLALSTVGASVARTQTLERVRPNDNRARAGIMSGGTLAIRMETRLAEWHPDGDDRPGVQIPVFAELGRVAQVPGPLIRAPGGTDVIVLVRNQIPDATVIIHGLHARPAVAPVGGTFTDSIVLAPGALQTLRFRLDRPGTYFYWGTTTGATLATRAREDAQLTGALVVDEPGARTPRDRVFVLGMWTDVTASDSVRDRTRELVVINGRAWPAADRVQYEKGDSVRWRVINASVDPHYMHLHGFHFRVTRRGDALADTALGTRAEVVHTERVAPGGTFHATWAADRLGTWLFHCEEPRHSEPHGALGVLSAGGSPAAAPSSFGLGGLVTAVEVKPAEGDTTWKIPPPPPPAPARRLRMLLRPNRGGTAAAPLYGMSLDDVGIDPAPPDTGQRIGPVLVLNRADPVSIWVVNQLPEPTSIHWHGIETAESVFDGVPALSGIKPNLSPLVAPGDSTEVRLAPPQAGTFAYHTMTRLTRQQRAGLVGALIVADRGKYDAATNVPVVVSSPSDSAAEATSVLINGSLAPALVELRRAVTVRLRAVNLTTGRPDVVLALLQDSTLATWRPAARDGVELGPADRFAQPARLAVGVGQTRDVEFTPLRSGDFRVEIRTPTGALLGILPVRVY